MYPLKMLANYLTTLWIFKNLQTFQSKEIYPIWWGCYPRHFALSKSLILQNHAHLHHHQQHKKHHKLDWAQDHGLSISFSPPTPPSKLTLASPPIFLAGTFTDSCLFKREKKNENFVLFEGLFDKSVESCYLGRS